MEKKTEENSIYQYEFNNIKYRCPNDVLIVRVLDFKKSDLMQGVDTKDKTIIAQEHPYRAVVVMVGDGHTCGIPFNESPKVKVGDIVYYGQNGIESPILLNIDGEMKQYQIVRESRLYLVEAKKNK